MEADRADASSPLPIDPARVRRAFSNARVLDADDFLQREVAKRMAERLATIRLDATHVLDAGCGSGADMAMLGARFDGARVCGVDIAERRLMRARRSTMQGGLRRWWRKGAPSAFVAADFASLPFASKRFDCIWSNLALHWSPAPHRVLPEWHRVLRVGGVVAFSAFGPDTLREVAAAFASIDRGRHVLPFTDMHDYGDMLVAAGFTAPVVDAERLTLTYADVGSLWRDVRALGGNASTDRAGGLSGRARGAQLRHAMERGRLSDGRYGLTFELVYAHAWRPEPRATSSGDAIVRMPRPR
jgi:malonyl-CoA O-methyltransferase